MAKRKVESKRGTRFRAPAAPRSEERKFREMMAMMVDEITERFRVNAIEELDQETIEKFAGEDASFQDANFAREFTRLANKVRNQILQQFTNDRIEKATEKIFRQADKQNRRALYGSLKRRLAIDESKLIQSEGLTYQANARIAESTEWVKKLRDESLAQFHHNSLQAMAEGRNIDHIVEQFRNTASKRKNHVRFLARTQINNFNSQMTRLRAERLGITKAIWVTAGDERVRACHEKRDGKEFNIKEGLYSSCDGKTLWPGSDYACRCTQELLIPGEDEREDE